MWRPVAELSCDEDEDDEDPAMRRLTLFTPSPSIMAIDARTLWSDPDDNMPIPFRTPRRPCPLPLPLLLLVEADDTNDDAAPNNLV